MRYILACSALFLCAAAPEPRSVAYFIMHDAVRNELTRTCNPHALRTTADLECNNAQRAVHFMAAADTQLAKMRGDVGGVGSIHSPLFWDQNALARRAELMQCDHPASTLLAPSASACRAARISEARNQ